MLVDFGYYHETYFGDKVPEDSWDKYEARAVLTFHRYTFNRLKGVTNLQEEAKMCICELAEVLHDQEAVKEMSLGVSSESADGHSVTYARVSSKQCERDLKRVCVKHLAHTGLLYPGRWCGC